MRSIGGGGGLGGRSAALSWVGDTTEGDGHIFVKDGLIPCAKRGQRSLCCG